MPAEARAYPRKRLASVASPLQKADLFAGTAARFYRLGNIGL